MTQLLDLTKPPQNGGLVSADMRNNLNSITSCSMGPVAPTVNALIEGMLWVDTSIPADVKLWIRVSGSWRLLFTTLQTLPQPGGGGAQVVYTQGVAAVTWTIAHGLGRYPTVVILDATTDPAQVIVPGSVSHTDANNLVVTFATAQAGRAILN